MAATKITFMNNGSARIEGDFELFDQDGNPIVMPGVARVSLCRCGLSANKPFCDGAHKGGAFASVISAATVNPPKPKPAS